MDELIKVIDRGDSLNIRIGGDKMSIGCAIVELLFMVTQDEVEAEAMIDEVCEKAKRKVREYKNEQREDEAVPQGTQEEA